MRQDIKSVLYSAEQIDEMVSVLADKLKVEYEYKNPIFVCILKGAAIFFCDLIRKLDFAIEMDFMAASSYGRSTVSSGEVRIAKDIAAIAEGRHIVLVEDIVDSGLTLAKLKELMEGRGAASVKICALLDKPTGRKTKIDADYYCSTVGDKFVVGYGLDFAEKYRNLPDICELKECVYQK